MNSTKNLVHLPRPPEEWFGVMNLDDSALDDLLCALVLEAF
jgi:hypothetical protein